ncbi:uncharacterized protein HMPREF1541_06950 [Cyphellophora europaea CBS 101466]|uniref:NAD-dependent epimerase/dehydratase domain-containing protein n=1 Tax=Cyphellophora europaea (strain CBS 101466) TaxID=1220924 RepID=W2RT52_CYPE1|nr:uncharacterized protein HMPREF1541_06950 [Cyphellophora europaea CBS 101466]ETN38908.1 hypothetical protein HMPREF1541_06950 [Cyphellophora europaea CBS 101466]
MVHLILTGATGLVGSAVLHHIQTLPAATNPITKLTILSRSPVPDANKPSTNNTKINVIHHTDYLTYPPDLTSQLSDAKAVIWAQGISQTEVSSDAEYTKITKEFPVAAAKAFASASATTTKPFNFVYVSGEGATQTPGLFTALFGRVKGEAELALLALPKQREYGDGKLSVYCPRPGGIIHPDKAVMDAILAKRTLSMRVFIRAALPLYSTFAKEMLIQTPELGKVLVDMALREGGEPFEEGAKGIESGGRVVRNVAIRRMAGL